MLVFSLGMSEGFATFVAFVAGPSRGELQDEVPLHFRCIEGEEWMVQNAHHASGTSASLLKSRGASGQTCFFKPL